MAGLINGILDGIDTLVAWLSVGLKQTTEAYCDLQTADSPTTLVAHDGSLASVLRVHGVNQLIGQPEFIRIRDGALQSLATTLSNAGYVVQVHFNYRKDDVDDELVENFKPAETTLKKLNLSLNDLLKERVDVLSRYCAHEETALVLWTTPDILPDESKKQAMRQKMKAIKDKKLPAFRYTQNLIAAIPELRDAHDSFVRSVVTDFNSLGVVTSCLDAHQAVHAIRTTVDSDFTDRDWRPILPGDTYHPKIAKHFKYDIADIMWPSLSHQVLPRDALNLDLKTAQVGDKVYATLYVDLFPKHIQPFMLLFNRVLQNNIPWRISFLMDGGGMHTLRIKRMLSSVLAFSSAQNRLLNDAVALLDYIELNTDDAVVRLRVTASTWAPMDNLPLLRSRAAQLARAIEGWGSCDVSELCGDPFAGTVSTMLGVSRRSTATSTVASLSDTITMLPIFRPSSPWHQGALMFRTPDGRPWPFQPGSSLQTTWIDLIYARPGSGKSVLSNALNLALCGSAGLTRLPRISVIDIGPSSSGLISMLAEALPHDQQHLVAYHRLRMTSDYAINPFDTQLGCRTPMPQERAFLVNFITLLATPHGSDKAYDGMSDMAGLVIDEAYKLSSDQGNPNTYTPGVEEMLDAILDDIGFVADTQTTWWEVTDALFLAGFQHEATLAQRYAMPLLGDLTAICRQPNVLDLFGKVTTPTGENLVDAFNRMLSSAIREYPILAGVTRFDLGDARVVSLDLDEVAKSGGSAADRQTAVMYMLARYIVARDFYLTPDAVRDLDDGYRTFHQRRIANIQEDPKRLVFDEFHRTSNAQSVRDQVVLDMREGRKWNVQIALISQSLDDFDRVMVEFGTSVFIMDAGPEQAIKRTVEVFGLSDTAKLALRNHVRGPREGGATFLAQFATKHNVYTQLLTLTLGPGELWAFSTTTHDAMLRNALYEQLGANEARRVLANLFPSGSASRFIEKRLATLKEDTGVLDEQATRGVIDQLTHDILNGYADNPNLKALVSPVPAHQA